MAAVMETKLRVPRPRRGAVLRPELDGLVVGGEPVRLTVVAAPPGFGKTTGIALALSAREASARVAWVSLDERDRDADSFWTYLLLALDKASPGCGGAALALHRTGAGIENVLTTLLNELSVLAADMTIVLDDYHRCDGPGVRPGMTFLLDHLPPQVRMIICTRADPVLPLARLRAGGELLEIRQADLRFTRAEAGSFLNQMHDLGLAESEVDALQDRTEGWVAALQLAALSLRGRADRAGFVRSFAGDDRFVVDYLVDEVLDRQPAAVRRFLLRTSVLERLTGDLCDAVTGDPGGRTMLRDIARRNLFLIPLDDRQHWFRYHQLFAGALAVRLGHEQPDDVPLLHRRARAWFEQEGEVEGAVHHALAAGETDAAAQLIEGGAGELRRTRQEAVIRRLVGELPDQVVARRPVLAVTMIGALMAGNEFGDIERRLGEVTATLAGPALPPGDPALLARLPAEIATYRAALALIGGDLDRAIAHADRARTLTRPDDLLAIGATSALTGLAVWRRGDLGRAHADYEVAVRHLRRAGHLADALGCSLALGDLAFAEGRLHDARARFAGALAFAGPEELRGCADMHVGLARVAYEQGDPATAMQQLGEADRLGEAAGLPQHPHRWRVLLAELTADQGDLDAALSLLDEAERVYLGDFSPQLRPIPALRARLLTASGDWSAGLALIRRAGVAADDPLDYLREYEHLTLAGALLADPSGAGRAPADGLLQRLLAAAEDGGRQASVIEVLTLQAGASWDAGDTPRALDAVVRAISLAEPEGAVAVFTRFGTGVASVIESLARRRPEWPFALRLRDTLLERAARRRRTSSGAGGAVPGEHAASGVSGLLDPLTERELAVLRMLRSDLDGPAIARVLHVSLSTVRTHTQRIYTKLGVNNRRAAVRRAHHLGLFRSTG